jgi:hypothetical protein
LVADVKAIEMDDTKNNNNMLMDPWNAIFGPRNESNEDDSECLLGQCADGYLFAMELVLTKSGEREHWFG